MSEKRIRRAKHDKENPYYMAARSTAQDKHISYDALGLLNYVLSKPDDWDIQPDDLRREKCAIKKVYSILKELIRAEYVERIYHRDDKKRIVMVEYIAHEKPLSQNLQVEKQQVEKGNRNTVLKSSQSTENTENTKNTENPILASDDAAAQPVTPSSKKNPAPPQTPATPPTPDGGAPPPSEAQRIADLIKAYLDASGAIKPTMYGNKTVRAEALALHKAGITPLHIQTYVNRLRQDAFWKGKEIKWAKICGEIVSHFQERPLVTTVMEPETPLEPIIEGEFDPTFNPDAFEKLIEDAANARAL